MRLEGEKLYYREITEADTDIVLKWRNSQYVREHFIYRKLITRDEHLSWLKNQVATGKVIQYIMVVRTTDTPIGSVYLRDVDYAERTAEYGIFIGEADGRGHGYGTEAAKVMTSYVFNQLKFDSLTLRVLADNQQAIRSYEKAGFCLDTDREENIQVDGEDIKIIFMRIDRRKSTNE